MNKSTHTKQAIIEVKNVGKKYSIDHQRGRYISLRDVIMNVLRAPLSSLKTKAKETVGLSGKENFWALKGIDFSVSKGEVVGIIGKNGAGKSTLLKILSQITPPTEGEIAIYGKVGSLLEVGTGFHPELTGRENIFLNGAILGMARKEIASKFNEIVAFAGIEKFLDTPVKHYSSGMYVRLAFSVAAHMEPDILIVDEVLAVGDAEFQKKCLGKMNEITKKDGRTILFVSHNLSAIRQICTRTIFLEGGKIKKQGPTAEVIDMYLDMGGTNEARGQSSTVTFAPEPSKRMQVLEITTIAPSGARNTNLPIEENFTLEMKCEVREKIDGAFIIVAITNQDGMRVADFMEIDSNQHAMSARTPGTYTISVSIPGIFNAGTYGARVTIERGDEVIEQTNEISFKIVDNKPRIYRMHLRGSIMPKADWETKKI